MENLEATPTNPSQCPTAIYTGILTGLVAHNIASENPASAAHLERLVERSIAEADRTFERSNRHLAEALHG